MGEGLPRAKDWEVAPGTTQTGCEKTMSRAEERDWRELESKLDCLGGDGLERLFEAK